MKNLVIAAFAAAILLTPFSLSAEPAKKCTEAESQAAVGQKPTNGTWVPMFNPRTNRCSWASDRVGVRPQYGKS